MCRFTNVSHNLTNMMQTATNRLSPGTFLVKESDRTNAKIAPTIFDDRGLAGMGAMPT